MDVKDRRPDSHRPTPEDFETPLTRTELVEANKRFRQSGVQGTVGTDPQRASQIVRRATKTRFNARRSGIEDFSSVGEYLKFLEEQCH